MDKLTILLTGSAGFIGFHVSKKLLDEGHNVIGIDNLNSYYDPSLKRARNNILIEKENYIFYQADISDSQAIEKIINKSKIDKICHLAAQAGVRYSLQDPSAYIRTNIDGFITILEAARKNEIKDILYASSSSVYGNNKMPEKGFSEKDAVDQPISIYGMTKRANELTAYTYHHLYGMNMTGLRFFTAYGPWGRPDMAYYSFTKAISEGKPIKVFNQGKMKRDFTYIDDVVDGVVAALNKSHPFEIFNIGNSRTVDLGYFIDSIEKELGIKAKLSMEPLQMGDVVETYANISHSHQYLGYTPQVGIEEGIRRFVSWYKEYYGEI